MCVCVCEKAPVHNIPCSLHHTAHLPLGFSGDTGAEDSLDSAAEEAEMLIGLCAHTGSTAATGDVIGWANNGI